MRKENKKRIERVFAVLATTIALVTTILPVTCEASFLIQDYDGETNFNEYTSTQGSIYFEIANSYAGNPYVEYIGLTENVIPLISDLNNNWNGHQWISTDYDINYGEYMPSQFTILQYRETTKETIGIGENEITTKPGETLNLDILHQKTEASISSIAGDNSSMNGNISIRDVYVWNNAISGLITGNETASVDIEILTTSDIHPTGENWTLGDDEIDNRYTDEDGHHITEQILWEQWLNCTIKKLGEVETENANMKVEVLRRIDQTGGYALGDVIKWYYPQANNEEIYKIVEANIPINITAHTEYNQVELKVKTDYTTINNVEDIILAIAEEEKLIMPDSIDIGGWLATSITGFMEAEIGMGITIGGILIMFIAFNSVIWLLKLFAGG